MSNKIKVQSEIGKTKTILERCHKLFQLKTIYIYDTIETNLHSI